VNRALLVETRDRQIVAVGLLTRDDVRRLGSSLKKVFFIDDAPVFGDLLKALDDAEHGRPHVSAVRTDDHAMRAWQRTFMKSNRRDVPQA